MINLIPSHFFISLALSLDILINTIIIIYLRHPYLLKVTKINNQKF